MNIEQFLSNQPLDRLVHQFFNEESEKKTHALAQSILVSLGQTPKPCLGKIFKECQYQLEVASQDREAVKKAAQLLTQVMTRASYTLKNTQFESILELLNFLMGKVFITVCSSDCIRCLSVLLPSFFEHNPLVFKEKNQQSSQDQDCSGSCSNGKSCCQANNNAQQSQSKCIRMHEEVLSIVFEKFLLTYKLLIKTYTFKTRKDVYKILKHCLDVIIVSQKILKQSIQSKIQQQGEVYKIQPLLLNIPITKQKLVQFLLKSFQDEKDPRNIKIIFSSYISMIENFETELEVFEYKGRMFETIEAYYPLNMEENDRSDIKISPEDAFSPKELSSLLDQCLLMKVFREQVRQMLIEKMLSPPIHQYANLYIQYINKYNPFKGTGSVGEEEVKKYTILTMNLLQRLSEEEYLQEVYTDEEEQSGGKASSFQRQSYTLADLISSILANAFSSNSRSQSAYQHQIYVKYIQFLHELLVNKLFNFQENNKFAGTIIDIAKTIMGKSSRKRQQDRALSCPYGRSTIFSDIFVDYVIFKFMHFWSAKGEVTFKLGVLIMALNKKLSDVSARHLTITQQICYKNPASLHKIELLLISLGKIYELHQQSDQTKILVLKSLIVIGEIFKKQSIQPQSLTGSAKQQYQIVENRLNKIRVLNDGTIYTDCLKISKQLAQRVMQKESTKNTEVYVSDPVTLKCYVDYVFSIFNYKEDIDVFRGFFYFQFLDSKSELNLQETVEILEKDHFFEVKLYALIRYVSLHTNPESEERFNRLKDDDIVEKIVKIMTLIFLLSEPSGKQDQNMSVKKLIRILAPYSYKTVLQIFRFYFQNLPKIQKDKLGQWFHPLMKESQGLENHHLESYFQNISKVSQVLTKKFSEIYAIEMENGQEVFCIIKKQSHDSDSREVFLKGSLSCNFMLYILKASWKSTFPPLEIQSLEKQAQRLFGQEKKYQNQEFSLISTLNKDLSKRLTAVFLLNKVCEKSDDSVKAEQLLTQLLEAFPTVSHQLECDVQYVQFCKKKDTENKLTFKRKLTDLYQPGMIEYFWNRELQKGSKKSKLSGEKDKSKIIELVEYLPERLLAKSSQLVLPDIIYQSSEKVNERWFDLSRVALINKICKNLPQSSLVLYILPFCIEFMLSCPQTGKYKDSHSKDIQNSSKEVNQAVSIQSIITNNKILLFLNELTEEKPKQFPKLKESLDKHKKKIVSLLMQRQIYHGKRVVRQSARNLINNLE